MKHGGLSVIIDAWPAHLAIFDNSPPGAAYPHERGKPYGLMLAYFRWKNVANDKFWLEALNDALDRIRAVAEKSGSTSKKPPYYSNLSLETLSVESIYRDNMTWLKKVKGKYDPTNVMGRCGGHKIPLPADLPTEDKDGDEDEDDDKDDDVILDDDEDEDENAQL
ncbi:hypothetical protein E1B28_007953 [Marasmius oreades]|uniref:Berberine/berberine-like domain-containing protein n=1 Tax=Marasmius oreades TaxID=181124 RepID=A0A9P7UUB0_9AGAR|nr:uncharacterized protein E1B28_007953 [Marasmius oreades]KAG7094353.1 hypothetical protein E1B28_007953 [Marasmius oreades]